MVSISQQWIDRVSKDDEKNVIGAGSRLIAQDEISVKPLILEFCASSAALEILRRKWLGSDGEKKLEEPVLAETICNFLFAEPLKVASAPLFRASTPVTTDDVTRQIATYLWLSHSWTLAEKQDLTTFKQDSLQESAITNLVRLSARDDGPAKAKDWLREKGIAFVINSALPSMRLDAACTRLSSGRPMIALTLRYDRVDNFWFTLLHELGHLKLHLGESSDKVFLDDLDDIPENDELEAEANAFARDSLIPRDKWRRSEAFRLKTKAAILKLAQEQRIHPAIIAGRIRFETKNFTLHSEMLGQDSVRDQLVAVGD